MKRNATLKRNASWSQLNYHLIVLKCVCFFRFFEQMSSIKTRKHYVIFDMAFSGLWALFYFVAFCYMANAWRQSDEMFNFAKSNVIGAIVFAFLSVLTWVSRMPYL